MNWVTLRFTELPMDHGSWYTERIHKRPSDNQFILYVWTTFIIVELTQRTTRQNAHQLSYDWSPILTWKLIYSTWTRNKRHYWMGGNSFWRANNGDFFLIVCWHILWMLQKWQTKQKHGYSQWMWQHIEPIWEEWLFDFIILIESNYWCWF